MVLTGGKERKNVEDESEGRGQGSGVSKHRGVVLRRRVEGGGGSEKRPSGSAGPGGAEWETYRGKPWHDPQKKRDPGRPKQSKIAEETGIWGGGGTGGLLRSAGRVSTGKYPKSSRPGPGGKATKGRAGGRVPAWKTGGRTRNSEKGGVLVTSWARRKG